MALARTDRTGQGEHNELLRLTHNHTARTGPQAEKVVTKVRVEEDQKN